MKDICQALYEYLSADADIKKRINGRIYPIVLPQDAPLTNLYIQHGPSPSLRNSSRQEDLGG